MIYIERRKTSNDVKQIKNLFQVHNLITNNKMRSLIILANKDDLTYQMYHFIYVQKKHYFIFKFHSYF